MRQWCISDIMIIKVNYNLVVTMNRSIIHTVNHNSFVRCVTTVCGAICFPVIRLCFANDNLL